MMMGDQWGINGWFCMCVCLLVLFSFATLSFTSMTDCRMFHLPNSQVLKSSFTTKMSSETATCPGCDHTFSLPGYQSHLALSRDPLCRAIFDKLKKAHDAYELLMSYGASVGADTDVATPFQGDTFRTTEDYASDMFGQAMNDNEVEPDNLPPLMEISDDEDDDEEDDEEDESELAAMVVELEKS